jgi:hypothetical protein
MTQKKKKGSAIREIITAPQVYEIPGLLESKFRLVWVPVVRKG